MSIIRALIPAATPYRSYKEIRSKEARTRFWILKTRTHANLRRFERHYDINAWIKFAIVRNPWDRAVSQITYLLSKGANPPFTGAGFKDNLRIYCDSTDCVLQHDLGASQLDYLTDSTGKVRMDYIGRFETLQEDFNRICALIGITPPPELSHVNGTKRGPDYRSYYDAESAEWVRRRFAADIEFFGYKF